MVRVSGAIVVRGLTIERGGRTVLPGIDLEVRTGSVTGLLGPSGCGKTTLLRALVGVQRVRAGQVAVLGRPAGSPPLRRRVGYMTQAPSVYADLTVAENLSYFGGLLGVGPDRVAAVVDTVDLRQETGRIVATLSGGERARVSLGAALLGEPDVLVLDEPTVGLDPLLREDLWATFGRLAAGGATLIISSHVMDEAAHCDDLLLMREGRILAQAAPGELLARTGAPDVGAAFLALIREAG